MEPKTALIKAMKLCSQREYCTQDILDKLSKWEVLPTEHQAIINQLINHKFIDHKRYTEAFINDKIKFNHWGKIKINYYLKKKQIDNKIVIDCLSKFNPALYIEIATEEIKKKWRKTQAKSNYELKNKVAKYIINKGFEPNLVFDIINHLKPEINIESL